MDQNNEEQLFKIEGFEDSQDSPLASKQKNNKKQKQVAQEDFFKLPQAKPLLSRAYIDFSKPKILIKQILIYKQPQELTAYVISKQPSQSDSKNHLNPQPKNHSIKQPTTIWNKYIVKSSYECIYLKYYRGNLKQFYDKNSKNKEQRKKLKNQLLKMCHNNQVLFNTYLVDLDFITEAGSSLIRNLVQSKLEDLYTKWIHKIQQEAQNQSYRTENNNLIEFDSKFQSANLFAVFQKKQSKDGINAQQNRSFDLVLQNDVNTKGYSNWFYFSIKSKNKGKIDLNIVNMQKNHSLYTEGMKVLTFSYQKWTQQNIQWQRDGYNYSFAKNQFMKNKQNPQQKYSTLSFSIDQKYDNDIIFIAANLPYSYSRLIKFLDNIQKVAKLNSSIYFKKQTYPQSISSNSAPVLTLTWKRDRKSTIQSHNRKRIIGIIARQHPCQTVSSFVLQGIVNSLVYLINENMVDLLKKYIFKIFPMVNVDGVIYGNSRCDISGTDVNRKWTRHPNKFLYPVLSQIKTLFSKLSNEGYQIDYFIDLHGHSKKSGTFIYSCKTFDDLESRCFSWLMGKISNKFCFQFCTFGLASFKRDTARGNMSTYVNNKKSMTVQTSFYGYRQFNNKIKYFQIKDFHQIGQSLLIAINAQQSRDPKLYNWENIKSQIKNYLSKVKNKHDEQDESDNSGSDSQPSQDQMTFQEKTTTFLPSNVAAKIGLVEIKVVQKRKPKKHPQQLNLIDEHNFSGQNQKLQFGKDDLKSSFFSKQFEKNPQNKLFQLRQTKSVTKISPFKFAQRNKKSFSTKKIRLAIDVKFFENKQKVSVPSLLPQIQQKQKTKRNFWSSLNKQYQKLLSQKLLTKNNQKNMEIKFKRQINKRF